jgi:hypothetical protein
MTVKPSMTDKSLTSNQLNLFENMRIQIIYIDVVYTPIWLQKS